MKIVGLRNYSSFMELRPALDELVTPVSGRGSAAAAAKDRAGKGERSGKHAAENTGELELFMIEPAAIARTVARDGPAPSSATINYGARWSRTMLGQRGRRRETDLDRLPQMAPSVSGGRIRPQGLRLTR